MDETDESTPVVRSDDAELKELMGLFDAPAFARRGQDLEYALTRLFRRLERERSGLLDMVHLRLKQWSKVATGFDDWGDVFKTSIAYLYEKSSADPPQWAERAGTHRQRLGVGRDLVASVERFNRRWQHVLDQVRVDSINRQIELYNRYYVFEKECVVGSARIASRYFVPKPPVTPETILADHPTLAVPELLA